MKPKIMPYETRWDRFKWKLRRIYVDIIWKLQGTNAVEVYQKTIEPVYARIAPELLTDKFWDNDHKPGFVSALRKRYTNDTI